MKLPLFPLQSVFYPGESVPLHIFEERYKQLVHDCREEALTFGIPVYINERINYGTEVQLVEVVNTYEGGEMDVVCIARQVFRVMSFENELPGKLYAGGEVMFLENISDGKPQKKQEVIDLLQELYTLMGVAFEPVKTEYFNSYSMAHKMGLSFEQEYKLLQISRESERLKFVRMHLRNTIQVLKEINRTKSLIEQNGHFRNFDPLDFKDFSL